MSTEIILTFAVLGITIILFVKEWRLVSSVQPGFGFSVEYGC